jgi:lysyl-tRNA synthetase class 2
MADVPSSSTPADAVVNLILDEVTGEKVSKTELKRRQKQRQKEEEKAKKAAAAPPKPIAVKKSNTEADEKELNPNVCCIWEGSCLINKQG